ncbi:thioredoxin domain-containing protein [Dokdonella soli]|uniref:Thioredoxin domain-containing protein n=1 Tax=Dokdonella soli TaxID=529810 RepID=A0ABN1IVK6_9GAMM
MSNRLATETSPYLRQHADNPVDWWPWGEEALAAARAQNKPILLSIGYAACHWCHVMAHESFEDEATARVMNTRYVNIKVDREERPDIDKVYQLAHQALARRGGGWPLTMFLTPDDLLPFYAGTYFPKTPRYNMPAFVQVLEGVRRWFDEKSDEVRAQNASLATFLAQHARTDVHTDTLDDAPIRLALERIAARFDAQNGGHLGGPKFPHASEIELLLRQATDATFDKANRETLARRPGERGDPVPLSALSEPSSSDVDAGSWHSPGRREWNGVDGQAASMAHLTLARMAERGLTDHLGGGFFRYCVDERWEIPHFEKMLYDNAQLLPLYAWASRAYRPDVPAQTAIRFDESAFADATRACAGWIARELRAPSGGFWSSLDADSEGEEGRYYVWDKDEVRGLLMTNEYAVVEPRYGFDRPPNFENHAWHLQLAVSIEDVATQTGISHTEVEQRLASADAKLLAARARRARPGLDDKILTAWNALTIAGAARSARWLEDQPLLAEAGLALDFLHANVWKNGRLYACHAGGEAKFPAYLDDHAFLLDALLALLQVRWNRRDLDWAIALADALLERFEDREHGGFFFTAHDAEALPQRPKPWMDESLPSGNGVAARTLLKLGHLLGETRYLDAAERTLRAAWPTLSQYPEGCCTLLLALDEFLHPRTHIVLRADQSDEAARWRDALAQFTATSADIYRIPPMEAALPSALDAQSHRSGGIAYVCRGTQCLPPVTDPTELSVV